ncbi:MAG: hypothetical protein ACOYMA_05920 [Bacteroidia bacterium]
MSIQSKVLHGLFNLPGFHTNRKIVVIESDDWGSIRMPSMEVYEQLLKKGIRVDNLEFNRYDALASESDLKALFEVLHSVKDKNGNSAIITANTIVANPDFDKIKASNYNEYYYEPFNETLKRYPEHNGAFDLWKDGIAENVFRPQFHGREHLNVTRWMKSLKNNVGNVRLAFDMGMYDLSEGNQITTDSYMDTLNFEHEAELEFQKRSIVEGLDLFEKLFGYRSATFIAPCYIWDSKLNSFLSENGVKALQGGWFQLKPTVGSKHVFKKEFHYTGERNKFKQWYLVRNLSFEPSINPNGNSVKEVIQRMEFLFRIKKPVIISSHRLNFIGFIDKNNRDKNLRLFADLLRRIVKRWPDVEFVSSDKLVNIIENNG